MKLVDMEQAPEKPSSVDSPMKSSDGPFYPYGLQINLDEKSLKKLGIKDMPDVKTKMKLTATVEVSSVSVNDSKSYGENRNLGLQITDMSLEDGSAGE